MSSQNRLPEAIPDWPPEEFVMIYRIFEDSKEVQKSAIESLVGCRIEDALDHDSLFARYLENQDPKVVCAALSCAGHYAKPSLSLLCEVRLRIFHTENYIGIQAINAIGAWYKRTGDPTYRDSLLSLKNDNQFKMAHVASGFTNTAHMYAKFILNEPLSSDEVPRRKPRGDWPPPEVESARRADARANARFKRGLEKIIGGPIEAVGDHDAVFGRLLNSQDPFVVAGVLNAAGDFITPSVFLLSRVLDHIDVNDPYKSFSAIVTIGRWYKRTSGNRYLEALLKLQAAHAPGAPLHQMVKFMLTPREMTIREWDDFDNLISGPTSIDEE